MDNLIEIYSYGLGGAKDKVAVEYPEDMARYLVQGLVNSLSERGYEEAIHDHGMLIMDIPNSVFVKGALSNNMSREMEKVLENIQDYIIKRDKQYEVKITSSDYMPESEEEGLDEE